MKKILVTALIVIMGMFIFCSCGDEVSTVTDQTGNLKYEIAEGWDAKAVSPSPSTIKTYNYGDCTVRVEALSYRFYKDPLQEALDFAVGECLEKGSQEAGLWEELPSDGTVADLPAKEVSIEKSDLEGKYQFSGIFTAIETETGIYTVSSITSDEELGEDVRKAHRALLDTMEYVTYRDPEVYAKNLLQFGEYICAVPGWDTYGVDLPEWSERVEYNSGLIRYTSDAAIAAVGVVPMDNTDLTDDVIVNALEQIYDGKTGPEADCSIKKREMVECVTGSGLLVEAALTFGESGTGTAKASALFVMDENGKAVCCISNTADSNAELDYAAVTTSIQKAEPVYKVIDSLYEKSGDYVGDNTAVSGMFNDLGIGVYGNYRLELATAEEPYGVIVKYSNDVKGYDFKREAIIMIGLIGNMDYVDFRDNNSDIVHYDYELAKSLMKYDVKKMAADKARLELFYLETLY